jgi:hypothetical protein
MLIAQRFSEENVAGSKSTRGSGVEYSTPRGQTLGALRLSYLLDRFYSWRGASGERYICSVFSPDEEGVIAGFTRAVAIGVARDGLNRRPVCVLSSCCFATDDGRAIRAEARMLGVTEWHVHFGAGDAGLRDLADSLLN